MPRRNVRKEGDAQIKILAAVSAIALLTIFLFEASDSYFENQGFFTSAPTKEIECERISNNQVQISVHDKDSISVSFASGPVDLGYGQKLGKRIFLFDASGGIPSGYYTLEIVTGSSNSMASVFCA
jgi:hypothetical protein